MIYAILNKLENDAELSSLLSATEDDGKIYPLFTESNNTCLVYTDAIVSGGDVKENRLEFRIITQYYDTMTTLEKRLNKLLDVREYEQGFRFEDTSILKSSLIGGGTLTDDATHTIERILIYRILWKQ